MIGSLMGGGGGDDDDDDGGGSASCSYRMIEWYCLGKLLAFRYCTLDRQMGDGCGEKYYVHVPAWMEPDDA